MLTESRSLLQRTVGHVFETLCFSEAIPVAAIAEQQRFLGATITFRGTVDGYLRLEAASDTADRLAESVLGVGHLPDGSDLAAFTLAELSNVICGRFMSALYPNADLQFAVEKKEAPAYDAGVIWWQHFRADSGVVRLTFQLDSNESSDSR